MERCTSYQNDVEMSMRVLAGDIGGTKVLVRLAEFERAKFRIIAEQRFESAAYDGLTPIIGEFLAVTKAAAPDAACFGIAGPIESTATGQVARTTNLPWVIETESISAEIGIRRVRLINDFQAIGYALDALDPTELVALQVGERVARAPRAAIGAGTGLGQTLLVWERDHYEALPTEGGHVDFAPTDDLQMDLLRFLTERYGRVSYERVLSGDGLMSLYEFFVSRGVDEGAGGCDTPAAVSDGALNHSNPAAVAALRLFASAYGAHAGNVALSYLAAGGVFIAGGIAPKILPALRDGVFMRAFTDKGRMGALLERFPVHVVTNEKAGLLGAVVAATRLA
jgi:glucokinase